MIPTLCEECDHVHTDTRKQSPVYWLCLAHKRIEGGNFIAPRYWAQKEPYLRCKDVNAGACPLFSKKRIADNGSDD